MNERAIVIGSGLGGLASALRLRHKGYDVGVVDRLTDAGGRAKPIELDGYTFDAGPTIITAPHMLDDLFHLHDRKLEDYVQLVECDPWYRIRFHDGEVFDYSSSLEKTLDEIRRFEPSDADRYLKFLDDTQEIFRVGFEELGDQPFLTPWSMIKLMPTMMKLRSYLSVWRHTSRYLKNDRVRQVFSFHPLLVGGNPFTTTSIYSLIHVLERKWGVHFAMGGTGALVRGLRQLAEEVGVEFSFGETVSEIETSNRRVEGIRLESGERMKAGTIVSNADAPWVYKNLLPGVSKRRWTERKVESMKYSMGLFVLYFGAKKTWPEMAHHEIHLGPRYKGLIEDIFERDRVADDFSLYLHAPTRTDASLAPEGCESMYALVPVPNLKNSRVDWSKAGPELEEKVLEQLDQTTLPGLVDNLEVKFHVTPEHFRDQLLSHHGTGFSVQPVLTQSAWFRFHNKSEEVDGLYFTGAGTQPGAGVPGVLCSAKIVGDLVPQASSDGSDASGSGSSETAVHAATESRPHDVGAKSAARSAMKRHGKTFSFASRLLPRAHRRSIETLYRFCRYVDDVADRGDDQDISRRTLERVRHELEHGGFGEIEVRRARQLFAQHSISPAIVDDFLEGVVGDLEPRQPETTDELVEYAYRVAGTVGLMFCRVVGVDDPDALRRAIDLGIAMQLTNISRDVREDFENGRVYLPKSRVGAETVDSAISGNGEARRTLGRGIDELLALADQYYRSADLGLPYLPTRVRWAVTVASRAYQAIGHKVSKCEDHGLGSRQFTTTAEKIRAAVRSSSPKQPTPSSESLHAPIAHLAAVRSIGVSP